ncbi:hypothetical protein EG68_04926 [Paragonimus skrjabini miyazakii]|uniref:Chorein N-terminal domain-containing protein n=1 Tax=Paragonimus skrjabini miyazakii TaxID=59628 RepID=A0A8S9YD03_9TREM|nr:hypothetical protein EG68_04926 [Paragonimus skrjabini miyazakii]
MQRYFKLETYVGKLIMSYLNTYVKLRDDQVAMSFWGGDVILNQLELRCESLEHLFPFPVGFRSGRVHELRIHVPWTKLNSENIIISLHTVECILALKQPASRTAVADNLADMVQPGSALSSTGFQDISASIAPGYLQSYLKRLLANIRFVVYNLNVKFLQDDIVLSLSGSVLDFHPTTPDWKPTFHSGGQESSYMINRKLQVNDMTLCLDHSGSSGYVEVYEEPLLYRFSLSCLVKLIYARESLRLSSPIMSTFNIHAQKLDLRLSPFQLHALVRLIEVFSAISAETFDWSKLSLANVLNVFQVETINSEVTGESLLDPHAPLEQTVDNGQQQSWASWVWSFVPAILPPNTELSDSDDNEDKNEEDRCEDPGQASVELIQSVYEDVKCQSNSCLETSELPYSSAELTGMLDTDVARTSFTKSLSTSNSSFHSDTGNTEAHRLRGLRRRIRRLIHSQNTSPLFIVGVFVDRLSVCFTVPDSHLSGRLIKVPSSKRPPFRLRPTMKIELDSLALQITALDVHFNSLQLGVRRLRAFPMGRICCCGHVEVCSACADEPTTESPLSDRLSDSTVSTRGSVTNDSVIVCPVMLELGRGSDSNSSVPCSHNLFYNVLRSSANGKSESTASECPDLVDTLPLLTQEAYFSKFTDSLVRNVYSAVWFDMVSTVKARAPNVQLKSLPRIRTSQTCGVRETTQIRLLSDHLELHLSPTLLHRLECLIKAVKDCPIYPSCLLNASFACHSLAHQTDSSCLTRFRESIPVRDIRLGITSSTTFFHASHRTEEHTSEGYPCLKLKTGPASWNVIAPMYVDEVATHMQRWIFPAELLSDLNEKILSPMNWSDDGTSQFSAGSQSDSEADVQLLMHIFTRMRFHCESVSLSLVQPVILASTVAFPVNSETEYSTVFCVPDITACLWNLTRPDYWILHPHASILAKSEHRLTFQNGVSLRLSIPSLIIGVFLLSSMVKQLNVLFGFLIAPTGSECPSFLPDTSFVSYFRMISPIQTIDLVDDGLLCANFPGLIHTRWFDSQAVRVAQLSVETDCSLYLHWPRADGLVLPILQRVSSTISNRQQNAQQNSEFTPHSSVFPLLGISSQFPNEYFKTKAPTLCHAVISDFNVLITPRLFEWLNSISSFLYSAHRLTTEPGLSRPGCSHSQSASPEHSVSLSPTALPYKLAVSLDSSIKQPLTRISSSSEVGRRSYPLNGHQSNNHFQRFAVNDGGPQNTCFSAQSSYCASHQLLPDEKHQRPSVVWDTGTWFSVRRFLNGIHGLFTQLNIQLLVLPSKVTIVMQNPSSTFVCQIFDVSGFSPFDLTNDHNALEVILPKLQLDNQARDVSVLDTRITFNPVGLKVPNVSWTQATRQLPILRSLLTSNINITTTAETVVPWFLRASDASLKLNGQTLSSGSLLATLIETVQSCTHPVSTIDWCLHVQLVLDELDHRRDVLCIPTLEQMFQAVNSVSFLITGLRQTFSSWTTMFQWLRTDFNGQLMSRAKMTFKPDPCFSSTASSFYENPVNKISPKRYLASPCGGYPVPPITGVKHQTEVLSQSPLLTITTNALPVRFWIQCSLPRATSCFILSSDCPDEQAVFHWFLKGAVFTVDLKQDSASFEVKLGTLSAELRRTNERVIPLLSPLESSFRAFDDHDLSTSQPSSSISPPTLISPTPKCSSSQSHFADADATSGAFCISESSFVTVGVSPSLVGITEHHCHSCLHTESSLDPARTVFHLICHLSCKPSTDGQSTSMHVPSPSLPSEIEPVISNLLIRGLLQPLDVFICPALIEQFTKLCETMNTGSQDASPRSLSSVALSQKGGCIGHLIQPHVLVKSFRVFYPLSRVLPWSRQSEPDTLAFCCESVELTPLVGNEIERPAVHFSYITSDDLTLTSAALAADSSCPTLQLTASVRGLSFRVTEFVSLLLPEGFIVDRSTEGRFASFSNLSSTVLAERQNPARYWNQGILRASWNCLPHPAPAWPIIQTFSVTLSYASAIRDSQSRYIYGDALELTIPDNVVVFADCKLLNRLSSVIQSSTVSSSDNCELSHPHPIASLFDRYFHPTSSMVAIPLRLLFAVRHVRLVTWTDQLNSSAYGAIAHTVVDISHPHLSIHLKTSGESGFVDQLDWGIEDMQIDVRITKLGTENTQRRRPLNWTRFTPVAFRPCRSPISFCSPSFPLRSFAREPISSLTNSALEVLFGTGFGDSDPHTGVPKPLLIIRMVRSVDNADAVRGPGIPNLNAAQDPDSWRQGKFNVDVNVGRAVHCSVNPGVIVAFRALIDAVLPEGQDKEVVKPVALNENNGLQWIHWTLTRFSVISGNLPTLKISFSTQCSDKLDSTAAACLQCDIQRTNFCVFSDDTDGLSFNRIIFQLCYQGIGIFVYPLFSPPLVQDVTSSLAYMAAYCANQCVSLLWPHTSLSCSGTARIATCPHIRTSGQAYRFPVDVELMFRVDDGCQIDVPVHGPAFHALRSLISVYAPLSCVQAPSAESVGITFCDQCAAEQPILSKDDLRGRTFALPSIFQRRVSEGMQLATDQALSYLHPCWPWATSETCLNQLPLFEHPWPCSNGVVFCDNLRGMYHYYSVSGQVTSIPIHDQPHVDCHWIGMTWMYAEPRTPVRVRVLPAPFGFIERYSELSYPHGLELPCRLQYWDCSAEQNGAFLTYATFGLQDSKVVDLLLLQRRRFGSTLMTNSEMAGSSFNTDSFTLDMYHRLQSTLDDAILRNVILSSVSDYHPHVFRGSSALVGTKVSAKVWRVLVDLRARPISLANSNNPSSSTDMSDPETIQSRPVALVHISPLMLAGCVELDSVQNRSLTPNQSMFCRLICPSLHIGLLQQQEPQDDQHPNGLELARVVFNGLSLTHKRSLGSFSSETVRSMLEFEQCTVCTANPNWACLQSFCRLHKFSADVTQPSGLVRSHLVDMQLRLGVDRFVALCHLTRILGKACATWMDQNLGERSGCTEKDFLPHDDQDSSDLRWMVVNCSDQVVFIEQLCVANCTPSNVFDRPAATIQLNELFRLTVSPRECKPWRPLLYPGFISNQKLLTCIRMRFGVPQMQCNVSGIHWSEPVETVWPPCRSDSQLTPTTAFALTIIWKEDCETDQIYPSLSVIFELPDPSGAPAKVFIQSDLIVRNLLPIELDFALSTSSVKKYEAHRELPHDAAKQKTVAANSRLRVHRGPSATFVCSAYTRDRQTKRIISIRLSGLQLPNDMDQRFPHQDDSDHWSDAFVFCVSTPNTENRKLQTSQRSLIRIPTSNPASPVQPIQQFHAVVTVEFRLINRFTTLISVITISPVFEVINRMPCPIQLQARCVRSYHSPVPTVERAAGLQSPWTETVPAAQMIGSDTCIPQPRKPTSVPTLPQSVSIPYLLNKAPDLLLTVHLCNGRVLFPEPVRLSPDRVLKKLTTTFLSSSVSAISDVKHHSSAPGHLIIRTIDYRYPSFRPKLNFVLFNCSSGLLTGDDDPLRYSLQLTVQPQLRLFNQSGVELQIRFLQNEREISCSSYTACIANRSVLVPSQARPFIQLGYVVADHTYWSSVIIHLHPTLFALSDDVAEESVVDGHRASAKPDAYGFQDSIFTANPNPTNLERISDAEHLTVHELGDGDCPLWLPVNIVTDRLAIFLVVRLVKETDSPILGKASSYYVVFIESRVHIRLCSSREISFTPFVVPPRDRSSDNPKAIRSTELAGEVNLGKTAFGTTVPLPSWILSHPFPFGVDVTHELCVGAVLQMLSVTNGVRYSTSVLLSSLSNYLFSDTLAYTSKNFTEPVPSLPQLISLPTYKPASRHDILLVTYPSLAMGGIVIEIADFPSHPSGCAVGLQLVNCTPFDFVVNFQNVHPDNIEKKRAERWQQSLCDALPVLYAAGGSLLWIPEEILACFQPTTESNPTTNSKPPLVLPFLHPSFLHGLRLQIGYKSLKSQTPSTDNLMEIDITGLFTENTYQPICLPQLENDRKQVHLCRDLQSNHGTTIRLTCVPSVPQLCDCTVVESIPSPLGSFSLVCDQISVNVLSCRPMSPSSLGPSADRSSLGSAPPMSPQDEFVRLTVRGFEVVGCLSRYIGSQLDVDLAANHFQLDNWAQNWTNKYDFPVILRSNGPTRLYARFETTLSPSFLFRSPVCSVFVCPPSLLHLSVEDTLLHDMCALVSDYKHVFMCSDSRDVLEKKPHRLWFFRRLHISRCNARVSLRAVLRVYLSCHEAPLNVAPFDLSLVQLGPHNTGLAISPEALSQVVSMHYFTEAMFQAGWVFGSLDMLGNVTGLLYSFAKGLNDLVYLRAAQPQDKTAVNDATVTDKLNNSVNALQLSMTIDAHANRDHTVMHEPEWSDSQSSRIADPGTTVRRIALLRRLAGGFNSFTRHTTGGLVRSVTGMAASVARNLDYLTLDTQHRQRQELTRRKQAPRDLTEGLQMGLSGFGLCLLGAVAGLADHPLQVLFKAMDNPVGDSNYDDRTGVLSQSRFVWTALGGLGRGLVGAVVKPVAGVAEFVAQTGTGFLHGTDLGYTSTALQRLGGPYISPTEDRISRHLSVDMLTLRTWALFSQWCLTDERITSSVSNSVRAVQFQNVWTDLKWITTGTREHSVSPSKPEEEATNVEVLWLAASSTTLTTGIFVVDPSNGRLNVHFLPRRNLANKDHSFDALLASPDERLPLFKDSKSPDGHCSWHGIIRTSPEMLRSLLSISSLFWRENRCDESDVSACGDKVSPVAEVPVPNTSFLVTDPERNSHLLHISRWQRIKEYLASTKDVAPIVI